MDKKDNIKNLIAECQKQSDQLDIDHKTKQLTQQIDETNTDHFIDINQFKKSLETKESFNRNKILLENVKLKPDQQKLILPTQQGFDVVKSEEIIRLQADGNFTQVYLIDGTKKMVCRFLKHFDDLLENPFVRVHRSHIINTNFVKSYHKNGEIILKDGDEIEVSGTYKENFLKLFK